MGNLSHNWSDVEWKIYKYKTKIFTNMNKDQLQAICDSLDLISEIRSVAGMKVPIFES